MPLEFKDIKTGERRFISEEENILRRIAEEIGKVRLGVKSPEFWSLTYKKGWASKANMKLAVTRGELTEQEYESITGESYVV